MKHQYAMSRRGGLVDVLSLTPDSRNEHGELVCPSCNHPLVAALSEKYEWHFRHKHDGQTGCCPETYLHLIAKKVFAREFQA